LPAPPTANARSVSATVASLDLIIDSMVMFKACVNVLLTRQFLTPDL
jgi:hypothetical protein